VHSIPERGSRFDVYLSGIIADQLNETESSPSSQELQGNGKRILFIEDDKNIRMCIHKILDRYKYVVVSASNAPEALELFNKHKGNFDIIFTDVVIPGKTGTELVDELLSKNPNIKVLFSSGYPDEKSQRILLKEKRYQFLPKPYSSNELLRRLKNI